MLLLLLGVAGLFRSTTAQAIEDSAPDAMNGWVEGKLQSMTLREKIGQMIMVDVRGTELTSHLAAHLKDGAYGNIILFDWNIQDTDQTHLFIQNLQDQAIVNHGVPLLVAVDQEGGPVDRLGHLLGMKGTRFSARTIGQIYEYDRGKAETAVGAFTQDLARRMHALGINMNLAPVLDLTDDRTSYIYERSYGGDPNAVSRIASQFSDVMRANRIVTTGKHFPNLSMTRLDSHLSLPVLGRNRTQLAAYEMVPFAKLKDRLGAIMMGHMVVPDIDPKYPASISYKVGRVLRRQVGWDGVVISDDLKMKALTDRYTLTEIVIRAVFADVDILLMAWGPDKQREALAVLEQCVIRGKIPMSRVDASVRRILELKRDFAR